MSSGCRQRFVLFAAGWAIAGLAVVWFFEVTGQILLFTLAYVGFLLAVEYSEPSVDRPTWHRRLRWVSVAGLVLFAFFVVRWIEQVIGRPLL